MTKLQTIVLMLSFGGMIAGIAWYFRSKKHWRPTLLGLAGLAMVFVFFHFAFSFPKTIETKDAAQETVLVVVCYLATLLGMAAQYIYTLSEKENKKFQIKLLVMPICASPIVFIPLLTMIQSVDLTAGVFSSSKLMIYLVAFQNGFFWREILGRRRKEAQG